MTDKLLTVDGEGILELTFNRPEKLNAISDEMWDAMREAVSTFASRRDLRVMLIRSHGKYFSSGSDLNPHTVPDFLGSTLDGRHWFRNKWHKLFDEIESIEKPIVVAHQGPCLGAALEMSLSCDFRLAARSARYGLPEIEFGALPGSGGISRLTRVAGPHWARWLVMAGEQVSATEALGMGIIHAVYPDEEFQSAVRAFCVRLVSLPYEALGLAKLSIDLATDLQRTQARAMENIANSILFTGAEQRELFNARLTRLSARRGAKDLGQCDAGG